MGLRATCPHCGGHTSRVRMEARCSCGWADPIQHEPYEPRVEIDLSADEARSAVRVPEPLLEEIYEQTKRPRISMRDGEPVLFDEVYAYVDGDDIADWMLPRLAIEALENRAKR